MKSADVPFSFASHGKGDLLLISGCFKYLIIQSSVTGVTKEESAEEVDKLKNKGCKNLRKTFWN